MGQNRKPRITLNVAAILAVMLADTQRSWYGLELAQQAEVGSATVYSALTRLERAGWIKGLWESVDPKVAGRPRRRLYLLTGEGARLGAEALATHRVRLGGLVVPDLRERP